MFKKKSVMSKVLLGILCCTACGNSSNIDFLENNKDQLNIYHTDGKTIISQQHLSEMDKDYSILENVRDSSEVIIKGTVMRQEGTFVSRGGASGKHGGQDDCSRRTAGILYFKRENRKIS